jgi:transposase
VEQNVTLKPSYKTVVGLDVHQKVIVGCVMTANDVNSDVKTEFCEFETYTDDLQLLVKWCKDHGAEAITMESTGIYWKSPYRALKAAGFNPIVVNARIVKNLRGRKTDIADSQWLAKLTMLDSIGGSFIPPSELDALRLVSRQRQKMTDDLAREKNRLAKVFSDAGVRLGAIVSDFHGVAARRMAECLISGGTPMQALKAAGKHKLRASESDLLRSLKNDLTDVHRSLLKSILHHIRELEYQISSLGETLLNGLKDYMWAIELLQTMPGIDVMGAAMLLVELGTDMTVFGSPERLASWAGLCPGQNESAGKRYSGRTRKGNRWVRKILTEAAHAASRCKDCMFEQKYKSLSITRGRKRSIVAIAHKMLRIIYMMLKNKEPYKDKVVNYEEIMVKRNAPRWINALIRFGFLVEDNDSFQIVKKRDALVMAS